MPEINIAAVLADWRSAIIVVLWIVGFALKNWFPEFPNRYIPIAVMIIGMFLGFSAYRAEVGVIGSLIAGFLLAWLAVAGHSSLKNTLDK